MAVQGQLVGGRTRNRPRPVGALCIHCNYRPALPHKRYPHLARGWCSDRCRDAYYNARDNAACTVLANDIRRMIGLGDGRGAAFTRPELETIARRLRRVLPYGGLSMMRPRTRRSA